MQEERERFLAVLVQTRLPFCIWRVAECLINQRHYTILISVVILNAFLPTLIAQKFFSQQSRRCISGGVFIASMQVLSVEDVEDDSDLKK